MDKTQKIGFVGVGVMGHGLAKNIALAAIAAMVKAGHIDAKVQTEARKNLNVDTGAPAPWTV